MLSKKEKPSGHQQDERSRIKVVFGGKSYDVPVATGSSDVSSSKPREIKAIGNRAPRAQIAKPDVLPELPVGGKLPEYALESDTNDVVNRHISGVIAPQVIMDEDMDPDTYEKPPYEATSTIKNWPPQDDPSEDVWMSNN